VRVNGCMSRCVPCDGLAACPGCPPPSPCVSWDRLQRPHDPNEDEAVLIMDGWMDFLTILKIKMDRFMLETEVVT